MAVALESWRFRSGEWAMREFAIGLGVAIFIALFMIYTYQPSLYASWFHSMLSR